MNAEATLAPTSDARSSDHLPLRRGDIPRISFREEKPVNNSLRCADPTTYPNIVCLSIFISIVFVVAAFAALETLLIAIGDVQ